MLRLLWMMICVSGCAQAQSIVPIPANDARTPATSVTMPDPFPARSPGEKVGMVRGILKQVDPIYNRLVIQTFGGRELRIAFDGQTRLDADTTRTRMASLPVGSVISVDTVTSNGKLFARSVRTRVSGSAELNGQVVRYDRTRSQLVLNDPVSPGNISLRVTPSTTVIYRGQATSAQELVPGMLVRVSYSAAQNAAHEVEIVAARGNSFMFEGLVIAVDLRSRVLSLSNDTDQTLRELVFGSLDGNSLNLLREGNNVSIQAEFDGEHYKIRTVTLEPQSQ